MMDKNPVDFWRCGSFATTMSPLPDPQERAGRSTLEGSDSRTMRATTSSPVHFGVFEFNTRSGELRKQGLRVRLCPQACQLLLFLLQAPGRIRTREELRHELWPASTFVNFDHSINKTVHELRGVLGDVASSPRFIETIAGQGYRFIPIPQHPAPASKSRTSRKIKSLAVLPLVTEGVEPDIVFTGGQITSLLIDALSRMPGVRVLAYSTVKSYTLQHARPQQIGKDLNVRGVILGELIRHDNDFLLHVELIDVADGTQLWGAQLKQNCQPLLDCAVQLAREILQQLQSILAPDGQRLHST
jgi:DNA-binding winged helix-turn-helix (wHTH) protein